MTLSGRTTALAHWAGHCSHQADPRVPDHGSAIRQLHLSIGCTLQHPSSRIIGAFLALNLTMSTLSLFTLLGIYQVVGLVSKNAILIVDRTNQLKEHGMHYREALIEAGRTRLRPIMMTTIAMVLACYRSHSLPVPQANGRMAGW